MSPGDILTIVFMGVIGTVSVVGGTHVCLRQVRAAARKSPPARG